MARIGTGQHISGDDMVLPERKTEEVVIIIIIILFDRSTSEGSHIRTRTRSWKCWTESQQKTTTTK